MAKAREGGWLTLGEASKVLGVDPDTLRRWADAGKVDVFTTPGGHRRFQRASLDALLPRPRHAKRQSLSALGEQPDRIAAEFRKHVRVDVADQSWTERFDADSLRWFRERGMRMGDLLLGSLDATRREGREVLLGQAEGLGREYGAEAARGGLSASEAIQVFLFFRARFMAEIAQVARRRSLEASQASTLFSEADQSLDRVLVALIAGHQKH